MPLRTAAVFDNYETEGPGRSLITVKGVTFYRHVVRNVAALAEILKPYRWTLALQGHSHEGERLRLFDGGITRYHTAPAIDHPKDSTLPSGIFIYKVRGEDVDDGEILLLSDE